MLNQWVCLCSLWFYSYITSRCFQQTIVLLLPVLFRSLAVCSVYCWLGCSTSCLSCLTDDFWQFTRVPTEYVQSVRSTQLTVPVMCPDEAHKSSHGLTPYDMWCFQKHAAVFFFFSSSALTNKNKDTCCESLLCVMMMTHLSLPPSIRIFPVVDWTIVTPVLWYITISIKLSVSIWRVLKEWSPFYSWMSTQRSLFYRGVASGHMAFVDIRTRLGHPWLGYLPCLCFSSC